MGEAILANWGIGASDCVMAVSVKNLWAAVQKTSAGVKRCCGTRCLIQRRRQPSRFCFWVPFSEAQVARGRSDC